MKKLTKLIIADDHPLFRKGLVDLISTISQFSICGQADDGIEAIDLIKKNNPDIAILDINMPGMNGFDVAKKIKSDKLAVDIIFLTMYNEEELFNKAMDLGVKGYILKECAVKDILDCIISVSEGKHYISPVISDYLVNRSSILNINENQKSGIDKLTPTEKQILQLIAENKTSKEIADKYFISIRTVDNHRMNICNKLSIHGSNALLKFALENKHLF
ncbi:MAG: response regulator transcription factor [Ignavibacteriaceae bacterium]|jgi:DNA-binding NarL/FixJ family response regulator